MSSSRLTHNMLCLQALLSPGEHAFHEVQDLGLMLLCSIVIPFPGDQELVCLSRQVLHLDVALVVIPSVIRAPRGRLFPDFGDTAIQGV